MKIKKYFLEKPKIGLLLIGLWCMSSLTIRAQDHVYEGNISVSTQANVDALGASGGALEGSITKIMGNVTISGSVTDLSVFNDIDTITGFLQVSGLTQLRALSQASGSDDYVGLTNLKMVGDYFIVGQGEIPSSSSLIGSSNTSLDSVGYFPRLENIGGSFEIRDNTSLDAVGSFPVLRSIGGRFRLRDNHQLLHIPDFDALVQTGQEITIEVNNKLITVGSFPRLETIGGDLNFSNNKKLTMRGTYPVLRSIGNNFKVVNCDMLQSINDFPSLTTISGSLQIEGNNVLSDCCGLSKLLSRNIISRNTTIRDNAAGCNSEDQATDEMNCDPFVESSMDEVRVPFFPSETSFTFESNTRWQLSKPSSGADWITMFSDATTNVTDSLIGGTDSRRTQTTVTIHNAENTPNELRTAKLPITFLDAAGEVLTSPLPDTLTVIQGTNQRYIGDIEVSTQAALDTLKASGRPFADGNAVRIIEGNVTISGSVIDLSIFNAIDTITGNLQVEDLMHLDVLNKETDPGSYEGFTNLRMIGGDFRVENNDSLISISTFLNLEAVKGNVELKGNNRLTYVEFSSLDSIDGYLSIQRNRSLMKVLFGELGKIGGALEVLRNTSLISLEMFPDLMSIGTSDRFVPSLSRESTSVSLLVEDNRNLRSCCVLSSFITEGSHAVLGGVYINDNFTGCDTVSSITCGDRSDFVLVTNQAEADALNLSGTLGNVFVVEVLGPNDAPITDLSVFNNITEITGDFIVKETSSLTALNSANSNPLLVSVGGDFLIDKNKSLMEIGNFSSLTKIGGNLAVRGNGSLEELSKVTDTYTSFKNLDSIGGYFVVSNNYKVGSGGTTGMDSIGTFPSLSNIGKFFSVINNRVLKRLGEFSSLEYILGYITVRSNPLLNECCGLPARVIGRSRSVNFERNGSSCSSLSREGLDAFSGHTSSCFVGNLVLRNQSEVDNVPSSLTSIRGGLMIGPDFGLDRIGTVSKTRLDSLIIRNVDALRNLREVSFVKVSGTHNLTSLRGLSSLAKVHGNISISSNPEGLRTLGDLSSLDSVGGYLLVHNNGDLENLGSLGGLSTLPSLLRVSSNPALRSLGDFSSLNTIGGSLVITDNEELLDLGDLSSLAGVGVQDRIYVPSSDSSDSDGFIDGVSIVIENNPELFLCCGLQNVLPLGDNAVAGRVYITKNGEGCNYAPGLSPSEVTLNFGGMNDCRTLVLRSQEEVDDFSETEISGSLVIASSSGTGGIKNLDKLSDITSVSGHLVISGNKDLPSLVGLSGLSKIGDNFYIQDNTSLSSLRGLTTLDSIGGSFRVRSNPSLLTLSSFPELDNIGGSYIIQGNTSLRSLGYSPLLQTIDSMYYVVNNPLLRELYTLIRKSSLCTSNENYILNDPQLIKIRCWVRLIFQSSSSFYLKKTLPLIVF